MHFRLPKPLHGWREFSGEVGIIVVGVLIALGAEQVVEKLRWREQVAQARHSLDEQLADSEFSSLERLKFRDCIKRQLDRTDELIEASDRPVIHHVPRTPLRVWGTSSWDSAVASGAVAHMDPDVRDIYANLFSLTGEIGEMNRKEYDLSGEISMLGRPRTLNDVSRDRLVADISRLRTISFVQGLAAQQWLDAAQPLHLRVPDSNTPELRELTICFMPDDPPRAAKA